MNIIRVLNYNQPCCECRETKVVMMHIDILGSSLLCVSCAVKLAKLIMDTLYLSYKARDAVE